MAVITGELWPLACCFTASGSCKLCESFSRPAPSRAVLCENCNPLTAPFVNELQMAARWLRVARYTPGSKRPGGVKQAQRRKTKDSLRMLRLKSRALKFQKREKCLHTVRSLLLFFLSFFLCFFPVFLSFCLFVVVVVVVVVAKLGKRVCRRLRPRQRLAERMRDRERDRDSQQTVREADTGRQTDKTG